MRKSFYACLSLLILIACEAPVDQNATSDYFSLQGLIDEQVELLSDGTLRVEKQIMVNQDQDQLQQTLDSTALRDELAIFNAFDPGRSQFKNAFEVLEQGSTTSFIKKQGEGQSLQWVKMEDLGNGVKITGEILEETSIYVIQKHMDLLVSSGKVKSYSLQGFQKMLYKDTTFFAMKATVE